MRVRPRALGGSWRCNSRMPKNTSIGVVGKKLLSGALLRDNSVSGVVRDNTAQGVTPRSPEAQEGHNSVNTCPNGASEESIGIYAKSRCQWSDCLIDLKPKLQSYGRLKL